jgi:hypothetical protein
MGKFIKVLFFSFGLLSVSAEAKLATKCIDYNGTGCPSTFLAGTAGCNFCQQCTGNVIFSGGELFCQIGGSISHTASKVSISYNADGSQK